MGKKIEKDPQAVQSHLTILQNVIQRMASNSNSSKTWCITLVSAILVVVADKSKPDYALIAYIPTLLFFFLDSYYLALEKGFRDSYNEFILKIHKRKLKEDDLFVVHPKGGIYWHFISSIISFSVWPFYIVIGFMIFLSRSYLL